MGLSIRVSRRYGLARAAQGGITLSSIVWDVTEVVIWSVTMLGGAEDVLGICVVEGRVLERCRRVKRSCEHGGG